MKQALYHLKRPYHFVKTGLLKGLPAQLRYGFPGKKIKMIAITGTDGKTTSSTLIYHLLNQAKHKTGLISTVAARIGEKELDTGLHTTVPSPFLLQKFLAQMVKEKCEYVVLEMTSHGVYQYRDWGVKPYIAGLTNITHEHLDYHLDYNTYLQAKALLLKKAQTVVLNKDDQSYYRMKQQLNLKKLQVIDYSLEENPSRKLAQSIQSRFAETYNHSNARLAVTIAQKLGLSDQEIINGLVSFPGVPGRMEEVEAGQDFRIIVDFAHTPNAVESVLSHLRSELKLGKKLIAVLGATGLRDQSKRPIMGQVASQLADYVVFTADDSRSEDTWAIIHQLKSQIENHHHKITSIIDRHEAIEFALTQLTQTGDIVALLGKGCEQSLAIGKKEIPWSDKVVATQIVKNQSA